MLIIKKISKRFGNRVIFEDLSCELLRGRIYTLVGANGAGKTTLFNTISGFSKPESGTIRLNQQNLTKQLPYQINRLGVGRTFQDLRLAQKMTVKENVVLAMKNNPSDKWFNALIPPLSKMSEKLTDLNKKADSILETYFLSAVQQQLAGEISYGQQKLLTLACCVANDAQLLLLDEPVAGINIEYRQKMVGLLQKMRDEGKTILMIEHNTEFIEAVTDEVLFLANGKLTSYAHFTDFKTDPLVVAAYLA